MASVSAFVLTEEHWGSEFKQARIGIYGSQELATKAAVEVAKAMKNSGDPENFSYLIEEDKFVTGENLTVDELISASGKAWRWWPSLDEIFAEVEQTA